MEQTFENILTSLLEAYEKNPNQDINALLEQYAQEMGLSEDGKSLLNETNEYIDLFAEKANSLAEAKENGMSRKHWVLEEIDAITEDRTEQEKAALASALSDTEEKLIEESLTNE